MDQLAKTQAELEQAQVNLKTAQAALEAEKNAHSETVKQSSEIVNELKSKVEDKSKATPGKVTVIHDKKKYHVAIPSFKLNGKVYKADDLKNHPEVVKELVEEKSGVLVPVA